MWGPGEDRRALAKALWSGTAKVRVGGSKVTKVEEVMVMVVVVVVGSGEVEEVEEVAPQV